MDEVKTLFAQLLEKGKTGATTSQMPGTPTPADGKTGGQKRNQASWKKPKGKDQAPMPKVNVSGSKAQNLPQDIPLPGSYLSKTASVVKNDPLFEEAYFPHPSEEFRAVADEQKIYSSCEAFMPVADATYNNLCAVNPSYKKAISPSLHNYYFGNLTYARLLQLHAAEGGTLTHGEEYFLDQIIQGRGIDGGYTMPKTFHHYLSGFGNSTIPGGRDIKFAFNKPTLTQQRVVLDDQHQVVVPGFFGNMEENIGKYAAYPSPGVLTQRVLQDLSATVAHVGGAWNLPAEIGWGEHVINRNCIGYARSAVLRPEAIQTFNDANVFHGEMGFQNVDLPLNIPLMNQVAYKLRATNNLVMCGFPDVPLGSTGQLVYEEPHDTDCFDVLTDCLFVARSTLRIPSAVGYLGSTFLYQVRKSRDHGQSVVPVDLIGDEELPDEVWERLNFNFDHSDEELHYRRFEVTPYNVNLRLRDAVKLD